MRFGEPLPEPKSSGLNVDQYNRRAFAYKDKYYIMWSLWVGGVASGTCTPSFQEVSLDANGDSYLVNETRSFFNNTPANREWQHIYDAGKLWIVNDFSMTLRDFLNAAIGDSDA